MIGGGHQLTLFQICPVEVGIIFCTLYGFSSFAKATILDKNYVYSTNFGMLFLEYQTRLMSAEYPIRKARGQQKVKNVSPLFARCNNVFFCSINFIFDVWFFSHILLKVQYRMLATFLLKVHAHLP